MADDQVRTGKIKQGLIWKILIGFGVVMLGAGLALVATGKSDEWALLNPLSGKQSKVAAEKKMEVWGFLPTWMVGKTKVYGNEIDKLVFLGVEVSGDGSLVWDTQSKKLNNDSYISLKNNISATGGKNILGIKLFDDKKIDTLIKDEEAKKKLMTEVRDVLVAGNMAGVNIDFEYMSNPTRILDDDFGLFLDQIKASGWGEVSIDLFANTVIKGDSERLKTMMGRVDKALIMAYDFRRPGADFAGPVAPISAAAGERSISEITDKIVSFGLDGKKVILAYPLYGYEWETDTNLIGSATRAAGYGATVFYEDGIGFTGVNWDEQSQSPWTAWQEKAQRSRIVTKKVGKKYRKVTQYYTVDQWHQAYFENERSLESKVELAKQAQVGGIGFWALGYEGTKSDLIPSLKSTLLAK